MLSDHVDVDFILHALLAKNSMLLQAAMLNIDHSMISTPLILHKLLKVVMFKAFNGNKE